MNTITTTNFKINTWIDYSFKIDKNNFFEAASNIMTENKIVDAIEELKQFLMENLNNFNSKSKLKYKILILFKIKTTNNQYRNISHMQIINLSEIDKLKQLFVELWFLRNEDYILAQISDIILTYKIVSSQGLENKLLKTNENGKPYENNIDEESNRENNKITFSGYNLPGTMDIEEWGYVQFISENKAIVYKKKSHLEYHVEFFKKDNTRFQEVQLILNDKILFEFKDVLNDKINLKTFTRLINNHEYIFEEGILILKKIKKESKFLTKIKSDNYNNKNFVTMDLETRVIDEIMSSYCVSIYDGKMMKSFYLTDFSNEREMLKSSIIYLMKRKYHNYRVYLHNFSKFDAIFLLRVITELSDNIDPIIKNGQFIDLKFRFANKYKLFFRDSLLLLPSSLRNLAENFKVENKGLFPYKFVNNQNIPLGYIGNIPDFKYFDGTSLEEYKNYCSNFKNSSWNLRTETIKYCELDCKVLYQIIHKFSDNVFKLFRTDILKYSTLSSLAFSIYRSQFLETESRIPLIQGEIYEFIKASYTGGSVDAYKPTPIKNENSNDFKKIYRYDVNSLYPFVMKHYPMPVGSPIYFEGDILKNISNNSKDKPFGIFEVEIFAPENIKVPLLQKRVKNKNNSFSTIAPIGNWTGTYFSDELYNATKYGYSFKIKRGYLFEKGNIFTKYVDFLYKLKKESEKGSPNYIVCKLLLNTLYGRLGMNPFFESHKIILNGNNNDFYTKNHVTNVIDLKNGKELISYFKEDSEDDSNSDIKNISVVVSSIVTASARIHMSKFKTNSRYSIYYTDTDSIDIDEELEPHLVGEELGQMKLEHIFDDAIFLGPKMYGGITKDYEYVRIKGLKNPLKFNKLKSLLYKDCNLKIRQEKWYRSISNGVFHIKDEIYTLMITDNKRKLVYNSENKFYDTSPLKLNKGNIVD